MAAISIVRRRRRSREEIGRLVAEFRSCGLSQRRFALSRGLNPVTFGFWLRRLGGLVTTRETGRALVPVRIRESQFPSRAASCHGVEVVLRNGRVLRVPADLEGDRLASLADILEAGC